MIKLLDCTLRDGGYVNDWRFGKDAIVNIKENLELSGVDIIELGFLRDEEANPDRTIFNDIKSVKDLIGEKLPNREYAVMAEVSNPFPLDKLEPYSEGAPEIIRVIVWKRMLKEGYEYCKGIVEKGYKLCVQPARVSQYTDEEFVDMIKMFNELNPMAIYVVDSWGTMYKDELLHYLKLADENLKGGVSVGYHGHNNMMQAFEVACAFCEQDLKRDLIIDASVYGIGRGAGNLNTELFAKWADEKLGKIYNIEPMIGIYSGYIQWIYNNCEKWGYSVPFLITAKHNANPNFASFYNNKNINDEIIEKAISSIEPKERIIFSKKKAEFALRLANKQEWNKRVAVVVITNRPKAIEGYFMIAARDLYLWGIDLIIYDSYKGDAVENVVKTWSKVYDNIKYKRWNGEYNGGAICSKLIDAYKDFADEYEYLLASRDGVVLNVNDVFNGVRENFARKDDIIVLNGEDRDVKKIGNKIYFDVAEFFKDQCQQMTILGVSIIKTSILKEIIESEPLKKSINYGMWQPIAFFHYLANKKIQASSWVGSLWYFNHSASPSSHWHNKILWQWGERWYTMITKLPSIYDKYKPKVLKFELIDCKPFSIPFLGRARKLGGLNLRLINRYKKFIPHVCNTSLSYFYTLAITPKFLVNKMVKLLEKINRMNERIGRYDKSNRKKNIYNNRNVNYDIMKNCFAETENIKSNLLLGSQDNVKNPFITVFIPTYKRLDLFKEALDSVLNQVPVDFEWNIIVVDNEPYEGKPNETEDYLRKLNNEKITYYRNDKNMKSGNNFNRGIYLAAAPWVMMLHDDDLLMPNTLLKMGKAIKFLSKQNKKSLGAISASYYQFKYNPAYPKAHLAEIEGVKNYFLSIPMNYGLYKLTNLNTFFTGHIGGSVPSNGTIFNRDAMIDIGGFNEDFGVSADLITFYNLEKKYFVYATLEPYGFYRCGTNQMSEFKNVHSTIEDNARFREYLFSKNIFNWIFGLLFRKSLYYALTKDVLNGRKLIVNDHISFSDYSDICNQRPNPILYGIWKYWIRNSYYLFKGKECKRLAKKALNFEYYNKQREKGVI